MEKEKVIEVLKKYEAVFEDKAKKSGSIRAVRMHEDMMDLSSDYIQGNVMWSHMWWAAQEAQRLVEENRMEKAMRWHGFIQGVLWAEGMCSLNSLKKDNMPAGSTLDPERV